MTLFRKVLEMFEDYEIAPSINQGSLFTGFVQSELSDTISLALAIFKQHPDLKEMIIADQDKHGLDKKRQREADANWHMNKPYKNMEMPLGMGEKEESSNKPVLLSTKPRMPAELVFVFSLLRAYLGNIKARKNQTFIYDSMFLKSLVRQYGYFSVPASSTILDNINLLSDATVDAIFVASIQAAKGYSTVDYKKLYFDSTRIEANSAWPTESKTIFDLLSRIHRGFLILRDQEIKINLPADVQQLLKEIESASKSIALGAGKKGAAKARKKFYQSIFRNAKKLIKLFHEASQRISSKAIDLKPSLREWVEASTEWIEVDLHNAELCVSNAKDRILKGKQVPNDQKVTGISDCDASIISKGTKPLVFGYKPQIGRCGNGFIVSIINPVGAISDQSMGVELVKQAIANTGVTPKAVSYDDGYTNEETRTKLTEMGVELVSFAGANGKRITPDEEYESKKLQKLRNERSMVESTMAQLKRDFDLDRFSRRGISAVTQELKAAGAYHNISLLGKLIKREALKQCA